MKKGFTLVEIIVSILILGIITIILFSTFIRTQSRIKENQWRNELTDEGARVTRIIWRQLASAQEILHAEEDSIYYIDQNGKYSSIFYKDSIIHFNKKRFMNSGVNVAYLKFYYYLPRASTGVNSKPVTLLPLDSFNRNNLSVIDWEIKIEQRELKAYFSYGVHLRGLK